MPWVGGRHFVGSSRLADDSVANAALHVDEAARGEERDFILDLGYRLQPFLSHFQLFPARGGQQQARHAVAVQFDEAFPG